MTATEIVAEYRKCKADYWYYLTTYGKTFDMDTGEIKLFATFNGKYDKPEYREHIHWFLDRIHERILARRRIDKPDICDEKSRQMYVTNSVMAYCTWAILFMDNFRGLVTHEKEDKMDNKTDFNTPFGMVDFMIEHNPEWLKVESFDMIRSHMNIGIKSRNSLLTGDAGIRPGAGGGFDLIYNTEFAHQSFTNQKLAAEREACKGVNILDSTPNGKHNAHAITCEFAEKHPDKSSFLYVPIHWKKRRVDEWYDIKKLDYNGDEAQIAQELDMSREGSVLGRAFKMFKNEHIVDIDPVLFRPGIGVVGFDFGWAHHTAAVFVAPFKDDQWVVLDEYMVSELPPNINARECHAIKNRWGLNSVYWIADPASKQRSQHTGKTFQEIYSGRDDTQPVPIEDRIQFEDADNAIVQGISAVNSLFNKDKLLINRKCTNLIDALNEAVYPTNKNNEVTSDKYKEDWYTDILDALRYAVGKLAKYQGVVNSRQLKTVYRQPQPQGLGMGIYGGGR